MQISKGKALGCTQLEMNKPEGEYSEDESDEDNAVFATQVSAQRFVYPTVVPPQSQPLMPMKSTMPSPKMMRMADASQLQPPMPMKSTMPSPKMMGKVDLQRKEELMMAKDIRFATHGLHRNFNQSSEENSSPRSHYAMPAESNYDYDESEDDDGEVSEDEYEVELEVSDDEEEDQGIPVSTSLLQKSASSSRIRGLFQTVLQKSNSGTELDMSRFKANLGTHLHRRQSITSHTNIELSGDTNEDSDDDEDQFEDCSEVPYENNKYYRVPL